MAARLVFDVDHVALVVTSRELPSEYVAVAVYCAVWPTVTDVGPPMESAVTDVEAAQTSQCFAVPGTGSPNTSFVHAVPSDKARE
jgi:hypothetical protein